MKWLKIGLTVLTLLTIVILVLSCKASPNPTTTTTSIPATAQKGMILLSVTGTGNLALSHKEDLAFEMAGTVSEITVSESDSVKKDQVLAKLDTEQWNDHIATLEDNITAAERQLVTKQRNLSQVQMNVHTAENNLASIKEVKEAQDGVKAIEDELRTAQMLYEQAIKQTDSNLSMNYWRNEISNIKVRLTEGQKDLNEVLSENNATLSTEVEFQIANKQLQLEQAKWNLEDAEIAITDAQKAIDDAQAAVAEARVFNAEIKAPFDGFVTKINVEAGKEVQKGTVALQIADPAQFEANIMVTEQDIFSVKVGGEANVSLDALSSFTFPAKITKIAPIATVSQGVVNYKVTVQLTSTRPSMAGLGGTGQRFSQEFPGGSQSTSLPTSLPNGSPLPTNLPRFSPGATPSGTGGQFPIVTGGNLPNAGALQNFTLKEGLSATVDVIVQQKENVLLVPSRAITRNGRDNTVQVVKGDTTETKIVTTGLSDSTNTEVTEGLNEGDQVMIKVSSSSSSSQNQGGMGLPGGGQFRMVVPR
jgi:multidrug efflux pump subunit AcrA (membrane-fusion protein)